METPVGSTKHSDTGNVPPSIPSSRETPTTVRILHLSCEATTDNFARWTEVPLVAFGSGGISIDNCTDEEKRLVHIPDFRTCNPDNFSWDHRTLLQVTINLKEYTCFEQYVICLCLDKEAKLPINKHLDAEVEFEDVTVYGDAFIFKMERSLNGLGNSGAKYLDVGKFEIENPQKLECWTCLEHSGWLTEDGEFNWD